jgi:hypothetical protein
MSFQVAAQTRLPCHRYNKIISFETPQARDRLNAAILAALHDAGIGGAIAAMFGIIAPVWTPVSRIETAM